MIVMITGHSCVCLSGTRILNRTYHREPHELRRTSPPCDVTTCSTVTLCESVTIECTIAGAVSACYYLSFFLLCLLSLLSKVERIYTLRSCHFTCIYECPQTTIGHNIFVSILRDRDSIGTIHQVHELHTANSLNTMMFQLNDTSCILSQGHETTLARCNKPCLNTPQRHTSCKSLGHLTN